MSSKPSVSKKKHHRSHHHHHHHHKAGETEPDSSLSSAAAPAILSGAVTRWAQLSRCSSLESGFLCAASALKGIGAFLLKSQRDLGAGERRKFVEQRILLPQEDGGLLSIGTPVPTEVHHLLLVSPSPSSQKFLHFRQDTTDCAKPTILLELWSDEHLICSLPTEDIHGCFYSNGFFGGVSWSTDETRVAYVAEKLTPESKSKSYFQPSKPGEKPKSRPGREFLFREDWGEQNTRKSTPSLFIFDLLTKTITEVGNLPENMSCGQPQWIDNNSALAFVGAPTEKRRLGVIYCDNRESSIYRINVDGPANLQRLSGDDDLCARYPRVSPDGKHVIFLTSSTLSAHKSCAILRLLTVSTGECRTVIDVVREPETNKSFPGLFVGVVPARIWISNTTLALTSLWRSALVILSIDIEKKTVVPITPNASFKLHPQSWCLLDATPSLGILASSSCSVEPWVASVRMPNGSWNEIARTSPDVDLLDTVESQVIEFDTESGLCFEGILWRNKIPGPKPLLVYPHGGPHSCFDCSFYQEIAFLTLSGFQVLLVNYRGSVGFGQDWVEILCGQCGTMDVEDCFNAARQVIMEMKYEVDPNRVGVIGGSHGGFLTGHLIGQHPEMFKVAVMRNPVTDISTMIGATDIPEWCLVEACGIEAFNNRSFNIPTEEDRIRMFRASPMYHVDKVEAPTLLMIGTADRRVPNFQSHQFYYALRERGIPTRMFVYEDPHAITKVSSEGDAWINVFEWFTEHL